MSAARKAKPTRPRKPIYFVVARARDVPPQTGVLVPLTQWDQRSMRARQYGLGTEVRAELKKRRNVKFHRLAHAIGCMVVDNVEGFAGMDGHDALKRLQRECGVFCDELSMTLDLGALGTHVVGIKQPRSMAFDEMDEGEFQQLVAAVYKHIGETYWGGMEPDQIALMVEAYEVSH